MCVRVGGGRRRGGDRRRLFLLLVSCCLRGAGARTKASPLSRPARAFEAGIRYRRTDIESPKGFCQSQNEKAIVFPSPRVM